MSIIIDDSVAIDAGSLAFACTGRQRERVRDVVLTHTHLDHIAGLPQLLNLRGGVAAANGTPLRVLYPEDSSSCQILGRFLSQFDSGTSGLTAWKSMRPGDQMELEDRRFLRAYATHHIPGTDSTRVVKYSYESLEQYRKRLMREAQRMVDAQKISGPRQLSERLNTVALHGFLSRISIYGRAPNGYGASDSCTRISLVSGKASATTAMETRGANSVTRATNDVACGNRGCSSRRNADSKEHHAPGSGLA